MALSSWCSKVPKLNSSIRETENLHPVFRHLYLYTLFFLSVLFRYPSHVCPSWERSLLCSSSFFYFLPSWKGFFWRVFLTLIKGLRAEGVTHCTLRQWDLWSSGCINKWNQDWIEIQCFLVDIMTRSLKITHFLLTQLNNSQNWAAS